MTFSGLPTPWLELTGWWWSLLQQPILQWPLSQAGEAIVSFLTVLGKLKRKEGGRERLLWFLVFCCEKELGATAANTLHLALLHLKVCPSVIFPPSLSLSDSVLGPF